MSMSSTGGQPTAGRRQGIVLLLGSSLTIMGSVMVAPIIPKLTAEFGATSANAHLLIPLAIAGPALAIAVTAPLVGWLSDRVGRTRLLVLATFVYALLGALPALLDSLGQIVVSRLLFGVAEAAVMTCCTTLIADYWMGEQRLRYINGQVITISLVGALFFVLGGALGENSWRTPFYLYLMPLLLIPAMLKFLWEPPRQAMALDATPGLEHSDLRPLVVNYLLVFGGMVLTFVVPLQGPTLLVGIGVTSSTLIGASAGLGLLSTLAGSLMWPKARRTLGIAGCNALLLLLMSSGLLLLTTATSYEDVLLAVTLHGIGAGMLVPNAMAPVMNALSRQARGSGMGVFTGAVYLGQFASPLIVGSLSAVSSGLHDVIDALALFAVAVALVWAGVGWRNRKGRTALALPSKFEN